MCFSLNFGSFGYTMIRKFSRRVQVPSRRRTYCTFWGGCFWGNRPSFGAGTPVSSQSKRPVHCNWRALLHSRGCWVSKWVPSVLVQIIVHQVHDVRFDFFHLFGSLIFDSEHLEVVLEFGWTDKSLFHSDF